MSANLDAARSDDRRMALTEARDTLASAIDTTDNPAVLAQLVAQYRATLAELDELKANTEQKAGVDELKRRRESKDRRTTADASANA